MRRAEAVALGLLHGPVELLPVSSSGHVTAVPWLLGWEVSREDGSARKALEVALHAGTAAALVLVSRETLPRPRPALLAAAVLPPALAGPAPPGPDRGAAGHAGHARRGAARRRGRAGRRRRGAAGARARRTRTGATGCCSGSRSARRCGRASRAAARRWRSRGRARFGRAEASRLSWEVGLPVLVGAAVRKRPRGEAAAGVAAFASTLATARAVGPRAPRPAVAVGGVARRARGRRPRRAPESGP